MRSLPHIRSNNIAGWLAWPVLLGLLASVLGGCHKQPPAPAKEAIEITQIPSAGVGGPAQLDPIQGRVGVAKPGQQVVIYAYSEGIWWIQPLRSEPFTAIQTDLTWKNSTHLGTEYAALLVDPGYQPVPRMAVLPSLGSGVVAIATAKGKGAVLVTPKVLHFSGYDWFVRASESYRGGQKNEYQPDNAWVDAKGYLHLRIAQHNGDSSCAEVTLTHSLGYGSYRFVVQDSAHLDPSEVMGMFTWDERAPDDTRKELDIELGRWGNAANQNAQFVVQPYYTPGNVSRFNVDAGVMTYVLRWGSGVASFRTMRGSALGAASRNNPAPAPRSISEHTFTSGIPTPAAETVHIDLYYLHSKTEKPTPTEVVVEKFEYLP